MDVELLSLRARGDFPKILATCFRKMPGSILVMMVVVVRDTCSTPVEMQLQTPEKREATVHTWI